MADLKGTTLAAAGSPVDKSYLILQAYYNAKTGGNLTDDATDRLRRAAAGERAARRRPGRCRAQLLAFQRARQAWPGPREIISVQDMLKDLGVSKQPPLLGWVFSEATAPPRTGSDQALPRCLVRRPRRRC